MRQEPSVLKRALGMVTSFFSPQDHEEQEASDSEMQNLSHIAMTPDDAPSEFQIFARQEVPSLDPYAKLTREALQERDNIGNAYKSGFTILNMPKQKEFVSKVTQIQPSTTSIIEHICAQTRRPIATADNID